MPYSRLTIASNLGHSTLWRCSSEPLHKWQKWHFTTMAWPQVTKPYAGFRLIAPTIKHLKLTAGVPMLYAPALCCTALYCTVLYTHSVRNTYRGRVVQRLHGVGAGPQRVRALRGLQAPGGCVPCTCSPYTTAGTATHYASYTLRWWQTS